MSCSIQKWMLLHVQNMMTRSRCCCTASCFSGSAPRVVFFGRRGPGPVWPTPGPGRPEPGASWETRCNMTRRIFLAIWHKHAPSSIQEACWAFVHFLEIHQVFVQFLEFHPFLSISWKEFFFCPFLGIKIFSVHFLESIFFLSISWKTQSQNCQKKKWKKSQKKSFVDASQKTTHDTFT